MTILEEKQLQLLHELVPGVVSVGFLVNSQNPNSVAVGERIDAAAKSLGLRLYLHLEFRFRKSRGSFYKSIR